MRADRIPKSKKAKSYKKKSKFQIMHNIMIAHNKLN